MNRQEIYNIAHELKTPLANITGFAQLLMKEESGPLSQEQRAQLKTIVNGSKRLNATINALMDLAVDC